MELPRCHYRNLVPLEVIRRTSYRVGSLYHCRYLLQDYREKQHSHTAEARARTSRDAFI